MCEKTTLCETMCADMPKGFAIIFMVLILLTQTYLKTFTEPWILFDHTCCTSFALLGGIVILSVGMPNAVYASSIKPI